MTVDITPFLNTLFLFTLNIVLVVGAGLIQAKVKDAHARAVLQEAFKNALGAIQVAGQAEIQAAQIKFPNVPPTIAVGVDYILSQAPTAAERVGLTPESIAAGILARIGVQNIETNKAIAASPSPEAPAPLAPVPVTTDGKVATGTTLAGPNPQAVRKE